MKTFQLGTRRYYAHVPRKLPRNPALVVALHAGAQTPEGFERMSGWSTNDKIRTYDVLLHDYMMRRGHSHALQTCNSYVGF